MLNISEWRVNKFEFASQSRECVYKEIKRPRTCVSLAFRRRSRSLPRIVNRNLIGRFTIFAGTRRERGSSRRLALFRVFLPHARTGRFQGTHVVYARTSSVVCQPLNTGHPRSSPIFSPIHLAADSATLLINETPHIYPVPDQRALSLPAHRALWGFALLHSCFTAYCEPMAGAFSTSRSWNRRSRDGCMDFHRYESPGHRYLADAPIGHR